MKIIDKIYLSPRAPRNKNVLWLDGELNLHAYLNGWQTKNLSTFSPDFSTDLSNFQAVQDSFEERLASVEEENTRLTNFQAVQDSFEERLASVEEENTRLNQIATKLTGKFDISNDDALILMSGAVDAETGNPVGGICLSSDGVEIDKLSYDMKKALLDIIDNEIQSVMQIIPIEEEGICFVDDNLNIGMRLDSEGLHAHVVPLE